MRVPATVEVQDVTREYRRGNQVVPALRGIDMTVEAGERVAIMGPSGCGKSTLLGLIGGLDQPTSGSVMVAGQDLSRRSREEITLFRRTSVGYILQSASLLPMLTARENVELPLALNGVDVHTRQERSLELLTMVGLSGKTGSLPEELSGGQQQRVSIARALAIRPQLILADEPAGSLDTATAAEVLTLIASVVTRDAITMIMVTHEHEDTRYVDRVVSLKDGRLVGNVGR